MKQDYDFEKQEDEDLRCPICNYYFSMITKPYLLPCNHNLCITCIDGLIKKKMLYCPLCRNPFSIDERNNFKVNFAFLHLVVKILKTKLIYCVKCSKIYQWTEHQAICDQSQFKETNEIFGELKQLAEDCVTILKNIDNTENLKQENRRKIFDKIEENDKNNKTQFFIKTEKIIENFFKNIPPLKVENYYEDIINFLKICEPIYNLLNLSFTPKDINDLINGNKNRFGSTIVMNENKIRKNIISTSEGNQLIRNCFPENKLSNELDNDLNSLNNIFSKQSSNGSGNLNVIEDLNDDRTSVISNNTTVLSNNFDKINYIISILAKLNDKVQQVLNYTRQVEFTSETIKSQIAQNYTRYEKKISTDLNSIYDNISLQQNKEVEKHYLINFINDSKKIWIYDIYNNRCDIKQFEFFKYNFNPTLCVNYDEETSLVYLSGGKFLEKSLFSNKDIYSSDLFIFPFSNGLVEINSNDFINIIKMIHARYNHSTIYIQNKLFLIGGLNANNEKMKVCEFYDTNDKKWQQMSPLNYDRVKPTLCIFKNQFLYVFRGDDEDSNSHVEFIDINNIEKQWTCVKIEDPGDSFTPCINSGAAVFNDEFIMIIGGYRSEKYIQIDQNKNSNNDSENNKYRYMVGYTYFYNTITKTIFRGKDLAKPAIFSHSGLMNTIKKRIVIIDEQNMTKKPFGVHSYHIDKNIWTFNK